MVGYGKSIEIFKQIGNPKDVVKKFNLENFSGTHGIGHTRMATESAITTDGSHPYSTGSDECLVHNGSLSNHNNLRRNLTKKGINFKSENDTEVAAGYISNHLSSKKNLKETLKFIFSEINFQQSKRKIIFFSPAGASFDSFKNFEDRGYYFNHIIKKYINAKQ